MRLGSAAFFERNCDEINELTELITSGLTRSPEKQNGKNQAKATTPPIWSAGAHIPVGFCGEYGACVGSAAFFERNCDEINELTELITSGLTRSPEKQNGKNQAKATTPPIWSAGAHIPVGFCGEYGACVGSAAFFERNCDEINK